MKCRCCKTEMKREKTSPMRITYTCPECGYILKVEGD